MRVSGLCVVPASARVTKGRLWLFIQRGCHPLWLLLITFVTWKGDGGEQVGGELVGGEQVVLRASHKNLMTLRHLSSVATIYFVLKRNIEKNSETKMPCYVLFVARKWNHLKFEVVVNI